MCTTVQPGRCCAHCQVGSRSVNGNASLTAAWSSPVLNPASLPAAAPTPLLPHPPPKPTQTAEIFFQKSFLMSADSAGPALLGPLFQILSLGLSAAAVTNYVQSGGAQVDQLDATLHKRLNASLSTFSIAQLSLLVS